MYRALRIVHILSVACFALFAVAICSLLVLASIFPHIEEGRAKAGIPSGDMHFFLRSDDPPGCYAQGFILETVVCHKIPDAHKKNILLSIPSEIVLYPFVSVISLLTDLDP
ncbi:MAG TPA: hypothetical protein PK765_04015 [bacterium]|nr:hypothetical protein [bacterium]